MSDLETEAKMLSDSMKWWEREVETTLERLKVLYYQENRDEKEIKKTLMKLQCLHNKGIVEIRNIDIFFKKWDID